LLQLLIPLITLLQQAAVAVGHPLTEQLTAVVVAQVDL
jgi:hypothetical protein